MSDFHAGSMGPKIQEAIRFAKSVGRRAGIGKLQDAGAILLETAGTFVDLTIDGLRFNA